MAIDVMAYEAHFIDHLAPIWRAMGDLQGTFYVDPGLVSHAAARQIHAEGLAVDMSIDRKAGQGDPARRVLVASYGDTKKARRLGYGSIAYVEHGIGQSYRGAKRHSRNGSYAGGWDRDDTSLFLVPNRDSGDRWRRSYPGATTVEVGSPRLQDLPAREPGPPTVAISFHWVCSLFPETLPALGQVIPHLDELARRFRMIGHGHPRARVIVERLYRKHGIPFVEDFEDVCRQADVYVCDNSSTIYEFASTGRPVVVMNAEGYRRNVEHGLRFWEAADVGPQVWDFATLGDTIGDALTAPQSHAAARERALGIVYQPRHAGPAMAVQALRSWDGTPSSKDTQARRRQPGRSYGARRGTR